MHPYGVVNMNNLFLQHNDVMLHSPMTGGPNTSKVLPVNEIENKETVKRVFVMFSRLSPSGRIHVLLALELTQAKEPIPPSVVQLLSTATCDVA